jgi:hypothetical protein
MMEYRSTTDVTLPLLCLICLTPHVTSVYVTSVNITAAGAAMKSERPFSATLSRGFTSSAIAYPHVAFQIVGGFADDRSDDRLGPSSPRT